MFPAASEEAVDTRHVLDGRRQLRRPGNQCAAQRHRGDGEHRRRNRDDRAMSRQPSPRGGTIGASGTISTNAAAGFPANIRITLNKARYADGNMVVATVGGALAITGAAHPRSCSLTARSTWTAPKSLVPENLGGGAAAIDVKHIDPPRGVVATLKRARANDGTPTPSARPSVVRLDVTVNAPHRIFVRGRGLDAELGGSVRLTGPVTDIQPVGGFQLIRGRLSILSQRITFDEGTVTLVGDLDPFLNLRRPLARPATSPFSSPSAAASPTSRSSSPRSRELPEDEVLARLIFNRGINELSPFQIAQLAAAAAELAGGSQHLAARQPARCNGPRRSRRRHRQRRQRGGARWALHPATTSISASRPARGGSTRAPSTSTSPTI